MVKKKATEGEPVKGLACMFCSVNSTELPYVAVTLFQWSLILLFLNFNQTELTGHLPLLDFFFLLYKEPGTVEIVNNADWCLHCDIVLLIRHENKSSSQKLLWNTSMKLSETACLNSFGKTIDWNLLSLSIKIIKKKKIELNA